MQKGDRITVRMNDGTKYHGTIKEETTVFGNPYYYLMMDKDFPYECKVLKVPTFSVELEG